MRRKQRTLTAATAVAALTLGAVTAQLAVPVAAGAATGVPDTLPLMLKNSSGSSEQVHIYVLGTSLVTGQQGWADADGVFHPWTTAAGDVPVPAPDVSLPGPRAGSSTTVRLPRMSGRIYFSYGRKLDFRLTAGGLVQPAPQNESDPNRDTLFNWAEYTLNDSGLWLNSTQVDMLSAPYAVGLKRADGSVVKTGRLKSGGYERVARSLAQQPGGWGNLVKRRSDGTVVRVLSPAHGVMSGELDGGVTEEYVQRVWSRYSASALTVKPFADRPDVAYYGTVSGGVMNFSDGAGQFVTSFQKPDAESIFNCHKLLDAPNDLTRGAISRTLCAGFNRGTLLDGTAGPSAETTAPYQDVAPNVYAREIHREMADGKAYAFAFDDVGNQEPLVHDVSPVKAYLTLDSLR